MLAILLNKPWRRNPRPAVGLGRGIQRRFEKRGAKNGDSKSEGRKARGERRGLENRRTRARE
ncbi:hypothetical protein HMPREF0972_00781 [Actinomyces sp. oral taxon 848 str. F0332]|nr:hypothetical protein HMPREF0972_00781 [Actinomyces sp. oral taxon 848 str. F0332]